MYNWVRTWGKIKNREVLKAAYLDLSGIFLALTHTPLYQDIPSNLDFIHYCSEPCPMQQMGGELP